MTYVFDCSGNSTGLVAPFEADTAVKNLFYPYDEFTLASVPQKLGKTYQSLSTPRADAVFQSSIILPESMAASNL